MKTLIFFILILLPVKLIAGGPYQSAVQDAQIEWNRYFQGKAVLTDDLPGYETQMDIDHQSCGPRARLILSFVQDYRNKVLKHDPAGAEKNFEKIQEILKQAKSKASPCLFSYQEAYVVGSSFLPYNLKHRTQDEIDRSDVDYHYIPFQNILKTLLLFKRGKISFFPKGRYHKILGAYACEESRIYLALDQHPFDLGASLIHEIDHLYRDKFIPLDELVKLYPSSQAKDFKLDWRTYILVDETLASTEATYSEEVVEYDFKAINDVGTWVKWQALSNPYTIVGDFSFVAPNRPLEKFISWSHVIPHYVILSKTLPVLADGLETPGYPQTEAALKAKHRTSLQDGRPDYVNDPKKASEIYMSLLMEVYDIVSEGYFNSHLTAAEQKALQLKYKAKSSWDGQGIHSWNLDHDICAQPHVYLSQCDRPRETHEFIETTAFDYQLFYGIEFNQNPPDPYHYAVRMDDQATRESQFDPDYAFVSADRLFEGFQKLDAQLSLSSLQCQDFHLALQSGQLNDYLGAKINLQPGNGGKTGTPIQPGNGGKTETPVQPGNGGKTGTPIQPGNGAKTGTDIKPGNGAKTATVIRPCILPSEKL